MRAGIAQERLHATVSGRGARTIVFANGLGTTQATWRHVVQALEPHARCIRFDHVGTTARSPDSFSPALYETLFGYADDVIALLAELAVDDCLLVGHSVGGMISLIAAAAAPERIGRLAVIAASPRYMDDVDYTGGATSDVILAILSAAERDFHAWVTGFAPLALGPEASASAIGEFSATLQAMRPDIALRTLRTIFLSDHRDVLPRVVQPVTILQPLTDVVVPPAVGLSLHAALPNAELVLLAATGHVPQLTAPDEIIAPLERLLREWTVA